MRSGGPAHFTGTAPCLLRAVQEFTAPHEYVRLPRSWQTSLGVQRQFGDTLAVTADYVYSQGRDEKDVIDNINLAFNPATGANYPVTDRARLPFPEWGILSMNTHLGRSAYHALQTSFTKRFSGRWQASGTYTLGRSLERRSDTFQRSSAGAVRDAYPTLAANGDPPRTISAIGPC